MLTQNYCKNWRNLWGMNSIFFSMCQIPIVDDEMKKAAGEVKEEDTAITQGSVQKLVTADGTYATQSAFSSAASVKKDISR